MSASDAIWLRQLEHFAETFRGEFRRADQARWAAVYLQGLLLRGGRKTVGRLAHRVTLPEAGRPEDLAQALQNFLNQSPWDEQRLWRRYWEWMAERFGTAGGTVVIEDLAFVKQGRHSVGVQRQYGRALGRKANCQVAVSLHYVGAGYFPLLLRLYLPHDWLESPLRLDAAGVPPEQRRLLDKDALALEMIAEVQSTGLPFRAVAAGTHHPLTAALRDGLAARGLECLEPLPEACAERVATGCRHMQNDLGLGHFEGRSWRGFHHHACLVMLAHGFQLAQHGTIIRSESTIASVC